MCGCYYFEPDDDELHELLIAAEHALIETGNEQLSIKTGDILPSSIVPVQMRDGVAAMRWGFKNHSGSGLVINARSETALEKPMFREAMVSKRCLIPASGYYEWGLRAADRQGDGQRITLFDGTGWAAAAKGAAKTKQKYAFFCKDRPVIYMAGCFRREANTPLPAFVILTRPATPALAKIHDRMPVILPEHLRDAWLAESPAAMREAILELQTMEVI